MMIRNISQAPPAAGVSHAAPANAAKAMSVGGVRPGGRIGVFAATLAPGNPKVSAHGRHTARTHVGKVHSCVSHTPMGSEAGEELRQASEADLPILCSSRSFGAGGQGSHPGSDQGEGHQRGRDVLPRHISMGAAHDEAEPALDLGLIDELHRLAKNCSGFSLERTADFLSRQLADYYIRQINAAERSGEELSASSGQKIDELLRNALVGAYELTPSSLANVRDSLIDAGASCQPDPWAMTDAGRSARLLLPLRLLTVLAPAGAATSKSSVK